MRIALIDYDSGNLFSVKNALEKIGCKDVIISMNRDEILNSDAVILPGVGAFEKAMNNLKKNGLDEIIKEFINTGKPFMGICLGLQLLFTESEEFGLTKGLDIIKGKVKKFPDFIDSRKIRVPQISWNKILKGNVNWEESELNGIANEEYFYFVHSFYVIPEDESLVLTLTNYEGFEYCSSIRYKNIFATQFHPEKSGEIGLQVFKNFKDNITK